MAKRACSGGGAGWWVVAAIVMAAVLLVWWFRAQRVEAPAPPAIESSLPSIREPSDGHADDEITHEEKAGLERIIQERSGTRPDAR